MPTAIIADDEAPMRDLLRARLNVVWPELNIVAEAVNGVDAVTKATDLKPDVVFLDIRMPGMTGVEAARVLCDRCHIVFVTAYDQYAIEAFERGAIDYLLKPVEAERLEQTRERLMQRIGQAPGNLSQLLAQLKLGAGQAPEYLRWIQASLGSGLRLVNVRDVLFFQSDEKYTRVQTSAGEYLIRKTLRELEEELDPREFWRIHRSTLVRVDAIAEVVRDDRGRQMVRLRDFKETLEVSRGHAHLFQQM